MSEALRSRLCAAAEAIAQAVEDELRTYTGGERLLTMEEVAERLGRHPQTVRRRARKGLLGMPVVEEDGDPRVRQADLDVHIRHLADRRRLSQAIAESLDKRPRRRLVA